ncbi:MAG: T9SS type A sorting domain-containing protein [Paludibacter sp.]
MRELIISVFAMNLFISLSAQEFSTKIYFKDAVNHKDSITVGYSSIATAVLNPALGEVNLLDNQIDTTFFSGLSDAIADANIDKYKKANYRTKTKYTTYIKPYHQQFLSIDVICNNFPITISWNKQLFQDTARSKSFITASYPGIIYDVGEQPHGLCYDDSLMYYTYNLDSDYSKNYLFEVGNFYIDSIHSKPVKIWTIFIDFAGTDFNTGFRDIDVENVISYTNPCENTLNLKFSHKSRRLIELYSITGILLYSKYQSETSEKIDVSANDSGIYLLKVQENNKSNVYKIVKK